MGALSRIVQGPLRSLAAEGTPLQKGMLAPARVIPFVSRQTRLHEPWIADVDTIAAPEMQVAPTNASSNVNVSDLHERTAESQVVAAPLDARASAGKIKNDPDRQTYLESRRPVRGTAISRAPRADEDDTQAHQRQNLRSEAPVLVPRTPAQERVQNVLASQWPQVPIARNDRLGLSASMAPLVVHRQVVERTIERTVQNVIVERPLRTASERSVPAERTGIEKKPIEKSPIERTATEKVPAVVPTAEVRPARAVSDAPIPPAPARGLSGPLPVSREKPVAAKASPPDIAGTRKPLDPRVADGGRASPPDVTRKGVAAPVVAAVKPVMIERAAVAPRVVPRPSAVPVVKPISQRPVAASTKAQAPRPAAPTITVSIGKVEVLTRAREAPPIAPPTMPRAHEIDPGLSFGSLPAGRSW